MRQNKKKEEFDYESISITLSFAGGGRYFYKSEVMSDCVPGIENKKAIIVTDENLQKLFTATLNELTQDFHNSEIYLVKEGSFDQAVDLAKYICMHDVGVVIGFGGGMVLDLAKYASFVSKAIFLCLPTTLSNDPRLQYLEQKARSEKHSVVRYQAVLL